MFRRVVIRHGLPGRFPHDLESHSCWRRDRVQCRPSRLINHRYVLHFQGEGISIGSDGETAFRNWNNPVKAGGRNWRMKIVDLVRGDRWSPEERQSYMRENSLLCCSSRPILSLHHAVVCCGAAECEPISLIVGADTCKSAAPCDATLEMVDMRGFEI